MGNRYLVLILAVLQILSINCMAEPRRTFVSSSLDMPCDYDKLKTLLSMDVDELIIDEDFNITKFKGKLDTNIPRIIGGDITFNIHTGITTKLENQVVPEVFIEAKAPVEYIGGISFNFNERACRSAILIWKTSETCLIENITLDHIDIRSSPLTQNTYIVGLNIFVSDYSSMIVRNIKADNLLSRGNGKIGDPSGNVSAIQVRGNSNIRTDIEIYNCIFTDLHNYDSNNDIILEDTNGIYVSLESPVSDHTRVHIHDISGVDYGKRLIKTDCSNLLIENITAASQYYDTLSAISLNNADGNTYGNALIRNVNFRGVAQYVVGSFIPHTIISDIYSEITMQPQTYTAAVLPAEDCVIKNLTLRGAQLIASITNTSKNIDFTNIDYDDTMYNHKTYGSSLFLTSNANITVSNIKVKSDKILYLFFDNYPTQTSSLLNVKAIIDNLNVDFLSNSNDWFLKMYGNNHIWNISIKNSKITFNGNTRGLIGISPSESSAKSMKLTLENVDVVYNNLNEQRTIPYGSVALGENTFLFMKDVVIYNKSNTSFSPKFHSLYVKNLSEDNTFSRLFIKECNVDECKAGSQGINAIGHDVIWSGGDCITHSNPTSITSLTRANKKFCYRDPTAGIKYKWTGINGKWCVSK